MIKQTRREFLVQTSLGSAAILAALSGCAANTNGQSSSGDGTINQSTLATNPVIAYVRDIKTGEIVLLTGTQERVLHDTDMVKRLLKASPGSAATNQDTLAANPAIAYIRDIDAGEIVLVAGAQEAVLHNTNMVKQLMQSIK